MVVPANAFELFGMKFFEDETEELVVIDPQPYAVTFSSSESGAVENAARNASSLIADEAEPASGAAGFPSTNDCRRHRSVNVPFGMRSGWEPKGALARSRASRSQCIAF